MAKRFHESYAGASDRLSQEISDGGMVPSGSQAFANMPTELVMKPYPKVGGYLPENLDDTLKGIDKQMNKDNSKKLQNLQPDKV